jgi:hypothetical protein
MDYYVDIISLGKKDFTMPQIDSSPSFSGIVFLCQIKPYFGIYI